MSELIIKAEEFAGTDVKDTAKEMVALAGRVGAIIEVEFNGVSLYAKPEGCAVTLAENYREAIKIGYGIKTAWSH